MRAVARDKTHGAAVALLCGCLGLLLAAPVGAQLSGQAAPETPPFQLVVEHEFVPADLVGGEALGASSHVDGDVAVITAPGADDIETNAGAAYVYRRGPGGWQFETKLAPADLGETDNFGQSCSLDGDVLVIAAPNHDAQGTKSGTAYVYRDIAGTWTFEQKLFPSTPIAFGEFGTDVAVSGNVIAVGMYRQSGGNLGRVFMYRHDGSSWVEEDIVTGADSVTNDLFAYALDVVVGAYQDDNVGSMYFHRWDGNDWVFLHKVFAPDAQTGDLFSKGVSMSGGYVVAGANREDQNGIDAGAAYVFKFNGVAWEHQQKLLASDGNATDRFGTHVAIADDTILVGARFDDHPGLADAGSAYVFRRYGNEWLQKIKLIGSDTAPADLLGHTVATDGHTFLVNAQVHAHGAGPASGASYAFRFPLHDGPPLLLPTPSVLLLNPGSPPVITLVTGGGGTPHHPGRPTVNRARSRRASGTPPLR
ncbi:MAG: hypothetical protein ACYTCU_00870 [Planctomycetota bacterium]|jgi:hypothetical protein